MIFKTVTLNQSNIIATIYRKEKVIDVFRFANASLYGVIEYVVDKYPPKDGYEFLISLEEFA